MELVDEEKLFELLEPLAKQRKVGFEWDGSSWAPKKGNEHEQLAEHVEPLEAIATVCPSGHPNGSGLRRTLVML